MLKKGKFEPKRPPAAGTLQGLKVDLANEQSRVQELRIALAEEQSRVRLLTGQWNSSKRLLLHNVEQRNQLRVDYDNHLGVCAGDRRQLDRLARFINTHYLWERGRSGLGGLEAVDIAIRYLLVERGRWQVRLRRWWDRWCYQDVKRELGEETAKVLVGGFYCQYCRVVLVDKQGGYCEKCLKIVSDLAERAR